MHICVRRREENTKFLSQIYYASEHRRARWAERKTELLKSYVKNSNSVLQYTEKRKDKPV